MYSQPFAAACVDDAPPARQWRTPACENDDLLPTHPDTSSLSPETHITQFFTTPETTGKDTVISSHSYPNTDCKFHGKGLLYGEDA